jgi:predicted RNase H-like nuclease (RuvC/YqgF family)
LPEQNDHQQTQEGFMTTILSQTAKRKPNPSKPPIQHKIRKDDDLIDLFPLPRYFQVHFEYLHENNQALRDQVKQLQQTLAELEAKLDRFIVLLGHPIEPEH